MSIPGIRQAFQMHGLSDYYESLELHSKLLGQNRSKEYATYDEFTKLFARPIVFAALANLCHLLMNNMKFTDELLALSIGNYQRRVYTKGLKREVNDDIQETIKAARELFIKEEGSKYLNR
eukprot:TRINITY_DN12138_c0_g1_i5.p2 TRINITY_DN12138_c0_g1~~TRINITY_DN12138_c0_g1_i5.p2  ORF type:complete len:121 (+),score=13.68 TRINITY_DN12138_c0_g1_i5:295-657(+)